MRVKFLFNVPAENMVDASTDAYLHIEAEVLNPGLKSEIAFIKEVKADQKALIGFQGSPDLFATVCKVACEHANMELEEIDQAIKAEYQSGRGNARLIGELSIGNTGRVDVVTVAEEVLK